MQQLSGSLGDKNTRLKDTRISKKLEALGMEAGEMQRASQSSSARSTYIKKGKSRVYYGTKGKHTADVMMEGDAGYDVERLQKALAARGLYRGAADGRFGQALTAAVRAFQAQKGLTADGVAGPLTLQMLGLY